MYQLPQSGFQLIQLSTCAPQEVFIGILYIYIYIFDVSAAKKSWLSTATLIGF